MLAGRWRAALRDAKGIEVVANADDPLVVFGAGELPGTRWVSAGGLGWRNDATGCPACLGRITFDEITGRRSPSSAGASGTPPGPRGGWRCSSCGFARPHVHAWLEDNAGQGHPQQVAVWEDGRRIPLHVGLPGRFNQSNALMSAVAAEALGVDALKALDAMAEVHEVAGRFTVRRVGSVRTQLLLAKNPAGWAELLELVRSSEDPIVVAINARVADGRDPSWLWDVPFEVLAGRAVVATGDRGSDLSVRLHYAGVEHQVVGNLDDAVRTAARQVDSASAADPTVQFVGNYTAFHDLLRLR